jgi:hypothetical protein
MHLGGQNDSVFRLSQKPAKDPQSRYFVIFAVNGMVYLV